MVPPSTRPPLSSLDGARFYDDPFGNSRSQQLGAFLTWFVPSVLVHLGVIAFGLLIPAVPVQQGGALPAWLATLPPPVEDQSIFLELPPPALQAPEPTRVVAPVSAPVEGPAPPRLVEPAAPPGAAAPGQGGGGVTAPTNGRGGRGYTAAERLRPGYSDRRLWSALPEEIVRLSGRQLAQLELDMAIATIADSMTVLAEAGRRATDWTYTDDQGRRWGVSPGQIHLGGITIPVPFGFSAPPSADGARRAWQDADVAGQAGRATAAATLKGRAREIRRRRDEERAKEPGDTISGR